MSISKATEEGAKAVSKLADLVSNTLGQPFKAKQIKKQAEAMAYAVDTIGDAYRRNSDVPIKIDDGKLSISNEIANLNIDNEITKEIKKQLTELIQRTSNRLAYQEITKQQNIEKIVSNTFNQLVNSDEIITKDVEEEWAHRFFDYAGKVSKEDLQLLWSKMLAGEIKKPGSFSKRTLEVFNSMSSGEAQLFQKLASFVSHIGGIRHFYRKFEVVDEFYKYDDLIVLQDAGLLNLNESIMWGFEVKANGKEAIRINNKVIVFENESSVSQKVDIPVYLLTSAGKEILNIIDCSPNENYSKLLAQQMKREFKNVNISLHKISNILESTIKYNAKNELEN